MRETDKFAGVRQISNHIRSDTGRYIDIEVEYGQRSDPAPAERISVSESPADQSKHQCQHAGIMADQDDTGMSEIYSRDEIQHGARVWVIKYRQDLLDRLAGRGSKDIISSLHSAPCRQTKRHRRVIIKAALVLAHIGRGPSPERSKFAVEIVMVRLIPGRFCLPNCEHMFHRVRAPVQ